MCRHTAHPVYNSDFHSSPRLKTVKGMLKQQGTAQVFQEGKSGLSHLRAVMMLILLGLRITWRHSTRCDYESVSPEGLTQQRRLPMWWNPSKGGGAKQPKTKEKVELRATMHPLCFLTGSNVTRCLSFLSSLSWWTEPLNCEWRDTISPLRCWGLVKAVGKITEREPMFSTFQAVSP